MRLPDLSSFHQFLAETILYSDRIPVFVQSGSVKNGRSGERSSVAEADHSQGVQEHTWIYVAAAAR